jgi:hypothetical protein
MSFRKKYLFYALTFGSVIVSALNSGVDAVVSKPYIRNPWGLGVSIFFVGIPISLFILYLGIMEPFPMDPPLLIIKSSGIIIMVPGIVSFAVNLVKVYIFITVKLGYHIEEIMI